mmetsp:Transcript_422/g.751  ORF Transcript_422/g.751 Transcript_422/m.751 type:complete len:129 (-) Transcript_422:2895-3281(-)
MSYDGMARLSKVLITRFYRWVLYIRELLTGRAFYTREILEDLERHFQYSLPFQLMKSHSTLDQLFHLERFRSRAEILNECHAIATHFEDRPVLRVNSKEKARATELFEAECFTKLVQKLLGPEFVKER